MTDGRNTQARILVALGAAMVLLAAMLFFNSQPADAGPPSSFVVDTAGDNNVFSDDGQCNDGPDGACSLRSAVFTLGQAAGGTITFDPSLDGTPIELSGEIIVNDGVDISITGNGVAETVIEAGPAMNLFRGDVPEARHFLVASPSTSLSLEGMTLTDGAVQGSGGSVLVVGEASFSTTDVHFVGNAAGDRGGAIYADAGDRTIDIDSTTFTGNSAFEGGAIHVGLDTATITNSTFSGNNAVFGAAIYADDGTVEIVNSTISGNTVDPFPVRNFRGINTAFHAGVVAENDENDTTAITITSSILEASTGEGTNECGGASNITSGGGNVVDDMSCDFTEAEDQQDTAANAGALGDNGGPTFTMALTADSPAVDAIASCELTVDQRGEPRPEDGNGDGTAACDAGAYELAAPTTETTTTTEPSGDVDDTATEAPAATPTQANPTFTG